MDALKEVKNLVERILPVSRYAYTASIIKSYSNGKGEILDIACGLGYGSFILHRQTKLPVIGIDIDEYNIKYARKNYENNYVKFFTGDITALRFKNNSFKYIVCLETIEHLGLHKAIKALDELARILKPDGLLIISSPNRRISNILYKIFGNYPYHLYEFTVNELERELELRNLEVIKKTGQYIYMPLFYFLGNKKLIPLRYFMPNEKIPAGIGRHFLLVARKIDS